MCNVLTRPVVGVQYPTVIYLHPIAFMLNTICASVFILKAKALFYTLPVV